MDDTLLSLESIGLEKKLVVFDLDGTLAVSKSPIDGEMSKLLGELLKHKMVAIISGGMYEQFQKQFLSNLTCPPETLPRLFLFPTNATRFYRFEENAWHEVYEEALSEEERAKIKQAFEDAFRSTGYEHPQKLYGEVVEDRGTQVTFSALGQEAPAEEKAKLKARWTREGDPRAALKSFLEKALPQLEIRANGMTSIDITRKGIDKAYGIRQIEKNLGIGIKEMLFVGDALFEGGNDYAVKLTGVDSMQVDGPEDTKKIIAALLKISQIDEPSST